MLPPFIKLNPKHICNNYVLQRYMCVVWCSLKLKKISLITIHFTASDKAQVALLGLMECVHLSEKTKSVISLNLGSSGQSEHFNGCGFGFTTLATTHTVMQHRSRSRWESAFLALIKRHIVSLRWLLTCSHFLLSPSMVLELTKDCGWLITTSSRARDSDCLYHHSHT